MCKLTCDYRCKGELSTVTGADELLVNIGENGSLLTCNC